MTSPLPVAIIGGGPCGLMTALLLARQGVASTVFERHPGLSTHPKAMGVSRRTAEIYRQLGLLSAMQEGSLPLDGLRLSLWSRTLSGEELGSVPLVDVHSPLTPVSPLHCPQTWTEQVLLHAVEAEPLVQMHFNAAVAEISAQAEGVNGILSNGQTFRADWLVAADGAGSGIRHQLQVETDGPGDMGHFLNVMFRAPYGCFLAEHGAILHQALWEGGFGAFVAVNGDDVWLMHHVLEPGETQADYPSERLARMIREASGRPDDPVEVLSVSPWVMSPKVARQFRVGRVLFTGDAAARLSPAGGLGLNTGLQAVHNLAWKLAAVIQGRAGAALLDTYGEERRGVALATMKNTNHNAEEIIAIVTAGLSGDWDQVRELIARSGRAGSHLGIDLGTRYEAGALLPDGTPPPAPADPVNDYDPVARPGSRAPHLMVQSEGQEVSLFDLFGLGFVLLSGRNTTEIFSPHWRHLRQGHEFFAETFESLYGITEEGGVLIRPDGYVAARWPDSAGLKTAESALGQILRQELPKTSA